MKKQPADPPPTRRMRLTDAVVATLRPPPPGQRHRILMEGVAGLRLELSAGSRRWLVQWEAPQLHPGKRGQTVTRRLGVWPELGCRAAKAAAGRVIASIRQGESPPRTRGAKMLQGEVTTFLECWTAYRAAMVRRGARPRTLEEYDDKVDRLLAPLHDEPLAGITRARVEGLHAEWTLAHGKFAANGAARIGRAVWNHGRDGLELAGLPERNVFRSTRAQPLYHKENTRVDQGMVAAELPIWRAQLEKLENPIRRAFHMFNLLSGMRDESVREMEWRDVSIRRRELRVPKTKTTGETWRPLSKEMIRCLAMARCEGRRLFPKHAHRWVWRAESASGHIAENKERGLSHVGNGLRATYRSYLEKLAISRTTADILYGHAGTSVADKHYIRRAALEPEVRAAQEKISAALAAALDG